MPGITVDHVDETGMIQGSAGDALLGSPDTQLIVPGSDGPFSVRVKLDESCPMWEIVSFNLQVEGVDSFYVKLGNLTSGTVQVQSIMTVYQQILFHGCCDDRVAYIKVGFEDCGWCTRESELGLVSIMNSK